MARKTNKFLMDNGLGEKIAVKQKNYLGNADLPTRDSEYQYTPKMTECMERCKNDIIYFAENFFTIIADGKRMHIPLREYQKDFLRTMVANKRMILCTSRQLGKCVSSDTEVEVKLFGFPFKVKMGNLWNILKIFNPLSRGE